LDVKMVAPFVDAFFEILLQYGFSKVKRGNLSLKDKLLATNEVTAFIGLSEDIRGIVAFSMNQETAKGIASMMMMGVPVEEFDEMAQSAISEMANMVTGCASIGLEQNGLSVQISPPTLIVGNNVRGRLSRVKTLVVEVLTEVGMVEINVGLEM